MINNWMVPRNKRKLYPVIDILSLFSLQNLGDVWRADIGRQLDFESELERMGIKRPGERRDRRAGGARTYESWLYALGLIFHDTATDSVQITLAGEELLNGEPPVPIITNQLMKLQYPSSYSLRSGVNINRRFNVRPFRFMLTLLIDGRIGHLTKQEIGYFVMTEGENESDQCIEHVIQRILDYRRNGDAVIPENFGELYPSSRNTGHTRTKEEAMESLADTANTFINFIEYTQLVVRDTKTGPIYIPAHKRVEVRAMLRDGTRIRPIDTNHTYWEENFQRNYGLAPGGRRDNRNFTQQRTVTDQLYRERRVRSEYLHIAGTRPITTITAGLIDEIAHITGFSNQQVEAVLQGFRPDTLSIFETSYLNMAISGTELAREFELATNHIFELLGFHSRHIGTSPLHPDVFAASTTYNFSGIIDAKAYRTYSLTNDHRNRMINNYIPDWSNRFGNLSFFMYVADGFGANIDNQIQQVSNASGKNGCVISARDLLYLLQKHLASPVDHSRLNNIFQYNRRLTVVDIESL
ncbi:AlwI family type II restriction endonuclease [Mesobacillus subterraneus]|uniref:AlwI family type II restriction endonuclease n=1 Tax=Mesobacillus subterraneus TaxID=285983 RepID=A0A3R9DUJ2_9BACI|nr:AlwI family type II restriction endonuclease [Mesobacillus subterraneus]RSD27622.1 AlwI family type II restriction endonuclease [Mesobacillus subterraneus]